jgi:peptide/nickel transport system permease protein
VSTTTATSPQLSPAASDLGSLATGPTGPANLSFRSEAQPIPVPGAKRARSGWPRFARVRPGLFLAGLFVLSLAVAAVAPGWLTSRDPFAANARLAFRGPSVNHLFGMDENGRDVLSRIVYGVRPSLFMGFGATAIGLGLGVAIGLFAGLNRQSVDGILMRGVDVLLAFPHILLALVIITFWGQGTYNSILAVGIANIPRYARLVNAQVHLVRRAAYVEAAVTLGLRSSTLVWRHVLPNAIKPVLILSTIGIGETIGFGAALSFLGLGAPPPAPEWGSMLSVANEFLANAWWLTVFPALAITLTVISVTSIGREMLLRSEGRRSP